MNLFDHLPLAAIIANKTLCVNGGISPETHTLHDIQEIDRHQEIPRYGPMCDLLWSGPMEDFARQDKKTRKQFVFNHADDCSYLFSFSSLHKFLRDNRLCQLVRSLDNLPPPTSKGATAQKGYVLHRKSINKFNILISVLSSPRYNRKTENEGAVVHLTNAKKTDVQLQFFKAADRPFCLPIGWSVFSWTLPHAFRVGMNVLEVVSRRAGLEGNEEEEDEEESSDDDTELEEQKDRVLGKLRTLARLNMVSPNDWSELLQSDLSHFGNVEGEKNSGGSVQTKVRTGTGVTVEDCNRAEYPAEGTGVSEEKFNDQESLSTADLNAAEVCGRSAENGHGEEMGSSDDEHTDDDYSTVFDGF